MTGEPGEDEELEDILFDDSGTLVAPGGDARDSEPTQRRVEIDPRAVAQALRKPERVRLRLIGDGRNHTEWRVEFGHLDEPLREHVRGAVCRAFDSAGSVVDVVEGVAELQRLEKGSRVVRSAGLKDHYRWMNTFKTRLQKILIEDCRVAAKQIGRGRFGHEIPYGFRGPSSAEGGRE